MSLGAIAETALQKPKEIPVPDAVRALVKGKIAGTLQVDFTGEGKPDYIVIVDNQPPAGKRRKRDYKEVPDTEFWITSDLKIVKQRDRWTADYNFVWFINLDDDPVPEIVSAYGYADGIDYAVYRQRFGATKDELLFNFLPVLRDRTRGGFFWGYPWDWTDIEAQRHGNHFAFQCTLDHRLKRGEDNDPPPEWQLRMPAIIFNGRTTQPEARIGSDEIKKTEWCDLPTLKSAIRRKPSGVTAPPKKAK